MLCAVIKGPTFEEARHQLLQATHWCSLVELRIDLFQNGDLSQLEKLRHEFLMPMIFTLRPLEQGGAFQGLEEERLKKMGALLTLKPEYIDLEYTVTPAFVKSLKEACPETQIIISFHDFEQMPPLAPILNELKNFKADLYKIAVMVSSSSEALSVLTFMRDNQPNVLAIGMGSYGEITRILAPIFGGKFVYASVDPGLTTAPGQLTAKQLETLYHYHSIHSSTAIYGLIGDPVSKSIGYRTHNEVMHHFNLSSVYVNFPLSKEQLPEFLDWAQKANLAGLSVTMPLKEEIILHLDEIDASASQSGAVNTLIFNNGKIKGFNTDGKGGIEALEEKIAPLYLVSAPKKKVFPFLRKRATAFSKSQIKGKKIIFMGAGGAIKALAKEAMVRGAAVLILNRHPERAFHLARELGCRAGHLDQIATECKEGYDILINGTPNLMPIAAKYILENCVVMDLNTLPQMTPFLEKGKEKGCTLVYGYEMFVNQAVGQFKIWFGEKVALELIKKQMTREVLRNLAKINASFSAE